MGKQNVKRVRSGSFNGILCIPLGANNNVPIGLENGNGIICCNGQCWYYIDEESNVENAQYVLVHAGTTPHNPSSIPADAKLIWIGGNSETWECDFENSLKADRVGSGSAKRYVAAWSHFNNNLANPAFIESEINCYDANQTACGYPVDP